MPVKMKSRQRITKVQLDVDANEDYILLGIVSAEPDYKLSLSINRKLRLDLRHKVPIELNDENGVNHQFSRFMDQSLNDGLTYNLISNKSGNTIFLKKLNKIDYLLQVLSAENNFNRENLILALRSVETITAVFPLEPGEIKDKNLQYLIL
jgi:regulatory protein YycI of two-component signal transduction system YycFG